jgi:hypothetical protein
MSIDLHRDRTSIIVRTLHLISSSPGEARYGCTASNTAILASAATLQVRAMQYDTVTRTRPSSLVPPLSVISRDTDSRLIDEIPAFLPGPPEQIAFNKGDCLPDSAQGRRRQPQKGRNDLIRLEAAIDAERTGPCRHQIQKDEAEEDRWRALIEYREEALGRMNHPIGDGHFS